MVADALTPVVIHVPHEAQWGAGEGRVGPLLGAPHFPVVIVGAGACGLTAALMLQGQGVPSLLLERDDHPQGSSALSSGFVPAAGTLCQARQGIVDSQAQFIQDIVHKNHDQSPLHLVQAYVQAVPQAIDALETLHGVPWRVLDHFLYPGHSIHRMHAVPETSGEGLMARLMHAAQVAQDQVTVLTSARVTQLYVDPDQRVVGLGYVRPDGSQEWVRAHAVLLASNGFGGNTELVAQHLPAVKHAVYAGHAGNDGSAVLWGQALGVKLLDMGAYQGHGSWQPELGLLMSWALMGEGGIQINQQGVRFHDESQGYSEASVGVLAQPGSRAWCVFDTPVFELGLGFPEFKQAKALGGIKRFDSVSALAAWVGCPLENLERTLQGLANEGESAAAPLSAWSRPLAPPLYAVQVTGALFHTQGGLDIDAHCRVLTSAGAPLPNLWAAGGAARGVSGQEVWGYLSGNGLLSALAGGFISAQSIAKALGQAPAAGAALA